MSFINDRRPFAVRDNEPSRQDDHEVIPTVVRRGAAIGTGAVIMCGITVGEQATVGAGSVVTRDVPPGAVVAGVPAKALKQRLTETETKC